MRPVSGIGLHCTPVVTLLELEYKYRRGWEALEYLLKELETPKAMGSRLFVLFRN